jgi:predicted Zn-dependent peptidase
LTGLRGRVPLLPAFLVVGTALWGQNLKQFEKQVTEFTLSNGLHFIVVERHDVPAVSFRTWVDAGSVNDPAGATGLARLFERVAYKGTDTIGTSDWASEKKALDAVEEANALVEAERNKGPRADQTHLSMLDMQLQSALNQAQSFAQPYEYAAIIQSNGGVGPTAGVTYDHTEFRCDLPSNRIELWFAMESQRLQSPVFREFYKERDAAVEEQHTRVESNPQALLLQDLLATAFQASPIHNPPMGWPGDMQNLRMSDGRGFFEKYYVPSNIIISLVGDVNPDEVRRLAERYFGSLPARPAPAVPHSQETAQRGPRSIQLDWSAPPLLACGYKRPDQRDPDDPVFRIMAHILSGGHMSVLYKDLVQDQRIAQDVQAIPAYPNGRFPSLFAFLVVPSREHTVEENQKALDALIAHLQTDKVDDESLNRARSKARAAWIAQLDSNQGLASLLPMYYAAYGDWRKLFTTLGDLDKVTAEDIQRVARKYLVPAQRTVAFIAAPPPRPAPVVRGGRQ